MKAIYTQNRQALWNYEDISRFHVTGNGTGIRLPKMEQVENWQGTETVNSAHLF